MIGLMPRASPSGLVWTIRSRPSSRAAVAKRDHLAEFPGRIDVQQRERRFAPDRTPSAPDAGAPTNPCRWNRAAPDCRIPRLPRADVDAFGFELREMRKPMRRVLRAGKGLVRASRADHSMHGVIPYLLWLSSASPRSTRWRRSHCGYAARIPSFRPVPTTSGRRARARPARPRACRARSRSRGSRDRAARL